MNKRIPFIALLIAIEMMAGPLSMGAVDILTSAVALFTLRPKDFLFYLLCSGPSVMVQAIQYAAYAGTYQAQTAEIVNYLEFAFVMWMLNPWTFYATTSIFMIFVSFLVLKQMWAIETGNTLRKRLKLRPRLYPEMGGGQRRRRDFGDKFVLINKIASIVLLGGEIIIFAWMNITLFQAAPIMHQTFSCYQLQNNATLVASLHPSLMQALLKVQGCR
jgi:hypothetical protein